MKFNKVAAGLIATACTASLFSTMASVSAADGITMKAGTASAAAGETFTIDIDLAGVPASGIAGLDFAVKYDSSVFEITGVKEGTVAKTNDEEKLHTNITDGAVSILWATGYIKDNSSWIKSDGTAFVLECKAKANGTASVEITKGLRADATGVDIAVENLAVVNPTVAKGTVTVGAPASTEPSVPASTPSNGDVLLGDVDCDGKIDITDLSVLAVALVDKKTDSFSAAAKKNADVTKDGSVELSDLATLKQFCSKQITAF